jgi:alpha-N-acetylglucosaminidase
MRLSTACLWLASLGWLGCSSTTHAAEAPTFDTHPEQAVLTRLLPHQAAQFELGTLPAQDGRERFRIASADGHIKVEGSTPSALLFGVNWYLKYILTRSATR